MIAWLGKPLCDKHWRWVCSVPQQHAYKKLGLGKTVQDKHEEDGHCSMCNPNAAEIAKKIEAKVEVEVAKIQAPVIAEPMIIKEENLPEKKSKQAYNDEIDKQLLELRKQNLSVGVIATKVGRSYASVTYRLRVLEKNL